MKQTPIALAALAAASVATPSYAGTNVDCSATSPISSCLAIKGNLNSNSTEAELDAAIEQLIAAEFDLDFSAVDHTKDLFTFDGDDPVGLLTFRETLFGEQILSVKVKNNTLVYLFDFGTEGATSVNLNVQGLSNALVITPPGITPGVPEPGTWMMMLMGFGAVGFAVRRKRGRNWLPQIA